VCALHCAIQRVAAELSKVTLCVPAQAGPGATKALTREASTSRAPAVARFLATMVLLCRCVQTTHNSNQISTHTNSHTIPERCRTATGQGWRTQLLLLVLLLLRELAMLGSGRPLKVRALVGMHSSSAHVTDDGAILTLLSSLLS
jgi:DMSO reductase anchor subunit